MYDQITHTHNKMYILPTYHKLIKFNYSGLNHDVKIHPTMSGPNGNMNAQGDRLEVDQNKKFNKCDGLAQLTPRDIADLLHNFGTSDHHCLTAQKWISSC